MSSDPLGVTARRVLRALAAYNRDPLMDGPGMARALAVAPSTGWRYLRLVRGIVAEGAQEPERVYKSGRRVASLPHRRAARVEVAGGYVIPVFRELK